MKKWDSFGFGLQFLRSASLLARPVKGVGQDVSAVGIDIDTAATAVQKKL